MARPSPTCETLAIERLFDDALAAAERRSLESHLDTCAHCRSELESKAAGPTWWRESKEHLSGRDDIDPDPDPGRLAGLAPYLDAPARPDALGRLGPYDVLGLVGRGGMGVVLLASDPALNRTVAVKVLAPEWLGSGAARRRFAREARAAAAVAHENVLAIHAVADADGLPYFVMPYVPDTLERRIREEGPLPIEAALRVAAQVAAGLAAAHAQGLVHRDVKPANLLLEEGTDRVRIADFGLARAADDAALTGSGVIAGTPLYMSPEQANGTAIDARSDLWSLGAVLYAMITGKPPFRAETPMAVLRKICERRHAPLRRGRPEAPPWLEELVDHLLQKDATRRPADAAKVAEQLRRGLAHQLDPAQAPRPRVGRPWRRIRRAVAAVAVAVAALAAAAAWWDRLPGVAPERPVAPAPAWDDGLDRELDDLGRAAQKMLSE